MGDKSRGDAKLAKFREGAAGSKGREDRDAFFAQRQYEETLRKIRQDVELDEKFGYFRLTNTKEEQVGWLINMHTTMLIDEETKKLHSAVDYYFITENGGRFKATLRYRPYFLLAVKDGTESEVDAWLKKKFAGVIADIVLIEKEDLDLKNHLIGLKRKYLKLLFENEQELMKVRRVVMADVKRNQENAQSSAIYSEDVRLNDNRDASDGARGRAGGSVDCSAFLMDIREYDVPYHVRVAIDKEICVGNWYEVTAKGAHVVIKPRPDLVERPEAIILAFDIECTKMPLKFPDAKTDQIMMISYMLDKQGYLIINREIVSEDIDDFEYTPKPEYEGPFIVWNVADEVTLLKMFFDHIKDVKPNIFVTFNGDWFDWPFVDARAKHHGIDMLTEIGFAIDSAEEYKSRHAIHMDAFRWVKRDSYLPQGSQGLKAVTKAKLGYDPLEIDPEDMCRFAQERPQMMSNYSVSDAVATYYLYMKYVHPFIFSLCTIIPMEPDEVLRKGSGTLCETLLMVQSYQANIVFPNKQASQLLKFHHGKLLESETYVGGHVESLESGVFRSDLPVRFRLVPEALQKLIDGVESAMEYTLRDEMKIDPADIADFDEVCQDVKDKLALLRDTPNRLEKPMIYHLDVSAMYPNIILTNRLQPSAMVDEETCAACSFYQQDNDCQRTLEWVHRVELTQATKQEFNMVKSQLEAERFPGKVPDAPMRAFHELTAEEQATFIKKRLKDYANKVYKKGKVTEEKLTTSTICMRENSFYIDTVRAFRDRRYIYKGKHKEWQKKLGDALEAADPAAIITAKNMLVLYESLQLAHKCILNSFYGYVMRKGARWFSMEMAGIVCYTGANIITKAREIVEQIGKPLELDTDGIWCILPAAFPENFAFNFKDPAKKKVVISYPGAMLNIMVAENFTNDQYQTLVNPETLEYKTTRENSIFFEVDGPYRAMILPASQEEDKLLKKRYAVFNDDGSLAELKGFELKRRGELQLIKIFQSQIFGEFLKGQTLEECYSAVGAVANHWLDILYSKAEDLTEEELFDLISENRSLSRELEDYGDQKSTSISAAKRLAEFLGDEMVKGKGLACQFIISQKPVGTPVTERAVPVAIFKSEPAVRRHYLRKWLKDPTHSAFDIRSVLDWNYYIDRLAKAIQKIITIPAAMQRVDNPVPRVRHPDWLQRRVAAKADIHKQQKISDVFGKKISREEAIEQMQSSRPAPAAVRDIEDFGGARDSQRVARVTKVVRGSKRPADDEPEKADQTPEDYTKTWREAIGEAPDRKEDYQAYLKWFKRKSAWQAEQRRRRRLEGDTVGMATQPGGALRGFVQSRRDALMHFDWHILQIAETDTPGEFKLFAIIGGVMRQLLLRVPRIFYVNCRSESPIERFPRVHKLLPRSQQCFYLYEFKMSEESYHTYLSGHELTSFLTHADVEGLYETHVPLIFRAIMSLGNVAHVAHGQKIGPNETRVGMDALTGKFNSDESSYLADGTYEHVYIYHSARDSRHVFGIFLPTDKAHIFVVDSVVNNQLGNVNKQYDEILANAHEGYGDDRPLPARPEFVVKHMVMGKPLYRTMQAVLTEYMEAARKPTLIMLQSPWQPHRLTSHLPALNDFPILRLPFAEADNAYPALQWQRFAVPRMFMRAIWREAALSKYIMVARYGRIPLANLPEDYHAYVADMSYARLLNRRNQILWVSPSSRPDLGGREEDDNMMAVESLDAGSFEVNNPGGSSMVTVELCIQNLAVNSISRSHLVHLAEGITDDEVGFEAQMQIDEQFAQGGAASSLSNYDQTQACVPAFKTLKTLIQGWIAEASHRGNVAADQQIMHMYRWLISHQSALYDPALHKLVNTLMKKVYMQLLAEFKRMGATVVYASMNSIIIATTKTTAEDALAYVNYITESIKRKEVFDFLALEPTKAWSMLLWMDPFNYGGYMIYPHPEETDENGEAVVPTEMRWNVAEYLPDIVRNLFLSLVATYLVKLNECREQRRHRADEEGFQPTPAAETARRAMMGEDSPETERARELIKEIAAKLYVKLPDIMNNRQLEFPVIAGSHLHMTDPALELVKTITEVLSLDQRVLAEDLRHKEFALQVNSARKNMLRMVHVGEFAAEAQFANPCLSFTLPELVCKNCNHCRDVDLCRDDSVTEDGTGWVCPVCQEPYDKEAIENNLLEIVQERSMAFQLQDLVCSKCGNVKADNMALSCPCSGVYVNKLSAASYHQKLRTFANIAEYHNLALLREVVEWKLTMAA